jgi:hypothetical protein
MPPEGYAFVSWEGDLAGVQDFSAHKISVTMDRNRSISANYVQAKYTTMTTRGYIHSSPLLYDINHDGYKEIIVGDMAGYIYCFNHLGSKLWEYYAGDAFDQTVSPIPQWFNPEVKNNNQLGNITIQSSCAAGDIDGDQRPEIICGVGGFVDSGTGGSGGTTTGFGPVGQGGILILNAEGRLKLLIRGWDTFDGLGNPVQDGFSDGFYSTPAIADLNNDGRLDLVIGGTDQNIYAFKIEGQDTSKDSGGIKVKFFRPPGRDGLWPAPVFEKDDDGDGKYNEDPVGDCTPFTYYNTADDVSGYPMVDDDGDGLIDEGAPGDDDEDSSSQIGYIDWGKVDEDEFEWPFRTTDTVVSSPAIADIDGDGTLNILIGGDSSAGTPLKSSRKFIPAGGALRALTVEAEEIGNFPQWIEQVIWSSPAIADIDRDGQKEVFVGTGLVLTDGAGELKGKGIYAFRGNGTPYLTGKSPPGLFASTQDAVFGSPAIGDINGDGELEVVVADFSGYLYAWNPAGDLLPGFPMLPLIEHPGDPHAQIRSSPILIDVDGDGIPEIVIGAGWSIVAVRGDGTMVPEFRYGHTNFTTGTSPVFATPAAADLDNNGKIDLVWVTGASNDGGNTITNGVIHVWELGNFLVHANPWPMFKRTGSRTSSYTIQFENPQFTPPISTIRAGDLLTVSVQVYPGISPISTVEFEIEMEGSSIEAMMIDNGSNGDTFAGDGRYTAVIQLPSPIGAIREMSFSAIGYNGEEAIFKVEAICTHINTLNLVTKYYQDILDRGPEPGGVEWWTAEINRIMDLSIDVKEGFIAVGKAFFNSEEYLLMAKTDAAYVTDLYETFLQRIPSQSEIDYWVGYLTTGMSRNIALNYFVYSSEFKLYMEGLFGVGATRPENNLVNDFYRGFLNRLPDSTGFLGYLGLMRAAQCTGAQAVEDLSHEIALGFIQSAEYGLRARADSQFVEDLYDGILRRGALPSEVSYWVTFLGTGTRAEALQYFTDSPEFQIRVQEVIQSGCFQ